MSVLDRLGEPYKSALVPFRHILDTVPDENGWCVPPQSRVEMFSKAGHPAKPEAPPRFVFHTTEVVNRSRMSLARMFHAHPTPPHMWQSHSGENSVAYPVSVSGSRRRALSRALGTGKQAAAPTERASVQLTHNAYSGFDVLLQRIPFSRIAWALSGTRQAKIETNHMGFCGQTEVEGFAGDTSNWSDASLIKCAVPLVQFARWLHIRKGIVGWRPVAYSRLGAESGTYGKRGKARMQKREWLTCRRQDGSEWNVCTHQNVPGNKHWDAGRLALGRVCDHANRILDELELPARVPARVPAPSPLDYAERIGSVDVSGSWSGDVEAVLEGTTLRVSGALRESERSYA